MIVNLVSPLDWAWGRLVIVTTPVGMRCGEYRLCSCPMTCVCKTLLRLQFLVSPMNSIICALLLRCRLTVTVLSILLNVLIRWQTLVALTCMLFVPNAVLECFRTTTLLRLAYSVKLLRV